jgi:Cu/Ag efflux protein CusF
LWRISRVCAAAVLISCAALDAADKEYTVKGMVLRADPANRSFVVSHEKIVGLMDSMIMPFDVRDAKEMTGVVPGAIVEFALVVGDKGAYATQIQIQRAAMRRVAGVATTPLEVGQRVTVSPLTGTVLVVNFISTRCAPPEFCARAVNNFGVLQKRFAQERGVVLQTRTFEPQRETPETLVAVIDRNGTLIAIIEGRDYSPEQLGDLVFTHLTTSHEPPTIQPTKLSRE